MIALFLGAGASVPYGMPTTRALRDKIAQDDLHFPRNDLLDSQQFPNIEHILSALDQLSDFIESQAGQLYVKFTESPPNSEEYDESAYKFGVERLHKYLTASVQSKEIIEKLITQNYKWDSSSNKAAEKILHALFDLVKSAKGHVTLFTTNYDTVIEEYCGNDDRKLERIDGFVYDAARRKVVWDGKFAPQIDDFPTKVFLYKLHGSMNWLAGGPGDGVLVVQKPDTGSSDDRTRDMYIRPSLDAKGVATKKEPYATILDEFGRKLSLFDVCIVVGYSFRDPHIVKELIKFATSGKTLVLLSPTATSDFRDNALKEYPTLRKKAKWNSSGSIHNLMLKSRGRGGIVYALNEVLSKDNATNITNLLKTMIKASAPARKSARGPAAAAAAGA